MNIEFELKPPTFTDFIYFSTKPRLKQEGFSTNVGNMLVEDLTEEQAIEYSEITKQAFLDHWKNKSKKHEEICIR